MNRNILLCLFEHIQDPNTYHNLALTCKAANKIAQEFKVIKKEQFLYTLHWKGNMYKVNWNGRIRKILAPDGNYVDYIDQDEACYLIKKMLITHFQDGDRLFEFSEVIFNIDEADIFTSRCKECNQYHHFRIHADLRKYYIIKTCKERSYTWYRDIHVYNRTITLDDVMKIHVIKQLWKKYH